jgi:hypothetical protein
VRAGICEWTTFPASFGDEPAAYRAAGAGAIGILVPRLAAGALPAEEIARRAVEAVKSP